ncbi:cytochrome P450 6k1-like isoform X2 [Schistocerca serialis cubense]|uniref:cytochrome P450 6k1-like isoform X2 n=1 Tax=Schistocerca serialis cubense TaxID=2023355 RepID=UPI00214E5480|nr:cytochrome P450 6k1-like isoform X2 [Schistocerca serialis cubense]
MAVLLDSWLAELVVVVSAAALALYAWMSRCQRHWQRKGAPYVEPEVPFGNFRPVAMGQKSLGLFLQDIYNMAPGARYVGFYGFNRPMLLIRDPELIRDVLIKDFGTFHDRGIFFDEEEPLNRHLFALTGIKWRQLRIKLSPAFTSGKLKGMFKTLVDCGHEMAAVLEGVAGRGETVEVRELLARYSTDFIASVGFGIEVHCQRDPDNEFRRWGRKIFEPSLITGLAIMLSIISPKLTRFIQVRDKRAAAVCKYFRDMVAHTVAYREKNNITRKDFMDLLIQLKNRGYLDGEKIENGDSTSKEVSQMETLRKYPPVPLLNREPNKEYKIPDSDVVLEKGTPLSISVLGLHRDPKCYPDPEHFDPERFSEQQKAQRQPYVYLPFGDGPRNCIGMRLGLLQVKVGLVCLLSKYNVRPTEKTRETLEYNARTVILLPNGGIQLRLEKRCS